MTGVLQEIRTHMNAIVGFSFLMEQTSCSNEEDCKYSNQISNSYKKLKWLFECFFEASIDNRENSVISPEKCRLNNFLDNIILEFRELLLLDNPDIVLLNGNHYSDLSEVYIDSAKVQRVIGCLIHNAINNTQAGYVKVGYSLFDGKVTFYVIDNGQDHSKCKEFLHTDNMDSSLTKFYDASSAIYIMLAKETVKVMGGTIWVDPHDNTGTGVYFSIPAKTKEGSSISARDFLTQMAVHLNHYLI